MVCSYASIKTHVCGLIVRTKCIALNAQLHDPAGLLVLQEALTEEYAVQPFCMTNQGSTLAVNPQWIKYLQVTLTHAHPDVPVKTAVANVSKVITIGTQQINASLFLQPQSCS